MSAAKAVAIAPVPMHIAVHNGIVKGQLAIVITQRRNSGPHAERASAWLRSHLALRPPHCILFRPLPAILIFMGMAALPLHAQYSRPAITPYGGYNPAGSYGQYGQYGQYGSGYSYQDPTQYGVTTNPYGYSTGYGSGYGTGYPNYPGGFGTGAVSTRTRNPRTGRYGTPSTGTDPGQTPAIAGRTSGRTSGRSLRTQPSPTPAGGLPPSPTPATGPASTRDKKPATVVPGAPPPVRAAAPAAPAVSAAFSYRPPPDVAIVYLTPFQASIPVGDELETRLSLANPGKKEFQTIEIILQYNPMVLEPIRLDEADIAPLIEGQSESVVFIEAGILTYRARLAKPTTAQSADFFSIRWKSLAPVHASDISFGVWQMKRTTLSNKEGVNILGGTGNTGALGMSLQVYSPAELADGPPIGDELFAGPGKSPSRGGIQLRLTTNREEIPVNEDFYVGVWFENPRLLDVSKLALKIAFDPNVLEVVDDDANNWITTGVNIFDGDFHDQFPFDIHLENSVSNGSGRIVYAVSCLGRRVLAERGYVARIRFRPKTQAASTPIVFLFEPKDDPLRTQATYLGNDLLGSPERDDDGVENLTVRIVEPRLPRLLQTEK
ncbi:MAG: cohesin domain-containing protein [Candidatus Sumerlaeia bacterium]|nr:cohesin domain-containing protein [Candidatus Sumerlaeia bacterium]